LGERISGAKAARKILVKLRTDKKEEEKWNSSKSESESERGKVEITDENKTSGNSKKSSEEKGSTVSFSLKMKPLKD